MNLTDTIMAKHRAHSNSDEFKLKHIENKKSNLVENAKGNITVFAGNILCAKCQAENPNLFCGRCKEVKHCSKKCQRLDVLHNMNCVAQPLIGTWIYADPAILESDDEIISKIEEQLKQTTFSNIAYYYKYKSELDLPLRNFRIINNPERKALAFDRVRINYSRILAYDRTISSDLVNVISSTYNITNKFGPYENKKQSNTEQEKSSFELLESCTVKLTSSNSFEPINPNQYDLSYSSESANPDDTLYPVDLSGSSKAFSTSNDQEKNWCIIS